MYLVYNRVFEQPKRNEARQKRREGKKMLNPIHSGHTSKQQKRRQVMQGKAEGTYILCTSYYKRFPAILYRSKGGMSFST
ncbi:hypothetical protein CPC08DRAFT_172292 [Agrocybe pediades]|nr:hypothetical protein CPC08DRAFT_172292 [Agrocybe pediades]